MKQKKSGNVMLSNVFLIIFIGFGIFAIFYMLNTPVRINSMTYNNTEIYNNTITNYVTTYVPDSLTEEMLNKTIDERLAQTPSEVVVNQTPALKVVGECMLFYPDENETICIGIPIKVE